MHTGRIQCQSTESGVNYYLNVVFGAKSVSDCLRFANIDHNFANLVAPPTDGTEKCLVRCKVHLVL